MKGKAYIKELYAIQNDDGTYKITITETANVRHRIGRKEFNNIRTVKSEIPRGKITVDALADIEDGDLITFTVD